MTSDKCRSSWKNLFAGAVAAVLLPAAGAQSTESEIPATLFGVSVANPDSFPLQVAYGEHRSWNDGAEWPYMASCNPSSGNPSNSCWNWSALDEELAGLKAQGKTNVMYTLSRTPSWAVNLSGDPTGEAGQECDFYGQAGAGGDAGQCLPPAGLNANGSGANAIWDNMVTAIATHANALYPAGTAGHIKYWEPWNEWYRNRVISGYGGALASVLTWAQMLRVVEDTRCIIIGAGTIHNYPSAGKSTSCASYLAHLGQSAIDPTAKMVMPSGPSGGTDAQSFGVVAQNFLYCNNNPKKDLTAGGAATTGTGSTTSCTWSGGLNWGSQAVDIINLHMTDNGYIVPEVLPSQWSAVDAVLSAEDRAKPKMCGECGYEGSGGSEAHTIWPTAADEAAFVPRFFAENFSSGVTFAMWYQYTSIAPLWSGSALTETGTAWNTTHSWLVGSTPANSPFCSQDGTVYTCPLTETNGLKAELVWDSKFGPGGSYSPLECSTAANPLICGSTSYSIPALYSGDWYDIENHPHAHAATVTIGAIPILLTSR
jgi:hypothetical protein